MIKERTNATIQPLSKSQLLPDGWSPQEVDTFFNGLNEHQMQVCYCVLMCAVVFARRLLLWMVMVIMKLFSVRFFGMVVETCLSLWYILPIHLLALGCTGGASS
jgi:hypothetical protein